MSLSIEIGKEAKLEVELEVSCYVCGNELIDHCSTVDRDGAIKLNIKPCENCLSEAES